MRIEPNSATNSATLQNRSAPCRVGFKLSLPFAELGSILARGLARGKDTYYKSHVRRTVQGSFFSLQSCRVGILSLCKALCKGSLHLAELASPRSASPFFHKSLEVPTFYGIVSLLFVPQTKCATFLSDCRQPTIPVLPTRSEFRMQSFWDGVLDSKKVNK